jgi:uncharacterized membrane protein YcgQ (UPF0703/DUF1980 family)
MRLERLGKLRNVYDFIETRTRDLPACSIVSQLTTLLDIAVSSYSDYIFMQIYMKFIVNIVQPYCFVKVNIICHALSFRSSLYNPNNLTG